MMQLIAALNADKSALQAQVALLRELRAQEQKAARKLIAGLQKLVDDPDDIEWLDVAELLSIYQQETP